MHTRKQFTDNFLTYQEINIRIKYWDPRTSKTSFVIKKYLLSICAQVLSKIFVLEATERKTKGMRFDLIHEIYNLHI